MISETRPTRRDGRRALSKHTRLAVLKRDDYRCCFCHRDLLESPEAFLEATVDHLVPVSRGGTHEPQNLRAACKLCNMLKYTVPADDPNLAGAIAERLEALRNRYFQELIRCGRL